MAVHRSNTTRSTRTIDRPQENKFLRHFKAWYMLPLHFVLCITLALVMITRVDKYLALDGNQPRKQNGKYILRASDVITIISAAIVVIRISIASYTASVVWRCAFVCLEKTGLTFSQLSTLMQYKLYVPWPIRMKGNLVGWMVALVMVLMLPQAFITPLLTGSLGWQAAFEDVKNVTVYSGDPNAQLRLWGWYQSQEGNRRAAVRKAAGLASQAWSNNVNATSVNKCRQVLNDDGMSLNSTVHNVTMPCLIINSLTWPTKTADPELINITSNSGQLSLSGDAPISYPDSIGIATMLDPSEKTLSRPATNSLIKNIFWKLGLGNPYAPGAFLFDGSLTAVVQVAKNYTHEPFFVTYFGKGGMYPNNQFADLNGSGARFTYFNVSFTAGVANPDTSTYVTNQVVEGNFQPTKKDIRAAPWVHEALYLLPDVMSLVAVMNTTTLDTYNNIENYIENLVRYSYSGAWTMLQRSFDEKSVVPLQATVRAPRLQALVSHTKVGAWLALSLLLTLSAIPMAYLQSICERATVADGLAAALLTDSGGVISGREHLTNISFLTDDEKNIKLKLQREGDDGRFILTGDRQEPVQEEIHVSEKA